MTQTLGLRKGEGGRDGWNTSSINMCPRAVLGDRRRREYKTVQGGVVDLRMEWLVSTGLSCIGERKGRVF